MIGRDYAGEPSRRPDASSADLSHLDASEITTARLYRVQEGDDLRSIASRIYGCEELWLFVLQANLNEIGDADRLRPGQILYLPKVS
jgi:nucleoid-associated protein YgaU